MTGPFLVRVLTQDVEKVGGNMGRLTAISTLGSVAGAVLIGYVLIPHFPNSVTMLITAGVLVALAAVYFMVWRRNESAVTGLVVAGLLVAGLGHSGLRGQFSDTMKYGGLTWEVLYRANSNYGELLVIEYRNGDYRERRYLNDQLIQNTYDPITRKSRSLFSGALRWLAHAYTPKLEKALCIGMGVGVVPMQFVHDGIEVDVVEINGAVVPMAEQHFDFDSSKLKVIISDGRQYLNQTDKRYDAIILDAFLGDSSPSHLMTKEAFTSIREHLSPQGVLVINSFGESTDKRKFFATSLDKTLRDVFGKASVIVHASGQGNVFFVATRTEQIVAHRRPAAPSEEARERMAATVDDDAIRNEWFDWWRQANQSGPFFSEHSQVQGELGLAWKKVREEGYYDPNKGSILLDDFNPVEFYDAHNREANRRGLMNILQSNDG
jgi:spermidine synthase